LLRIEHVKIYNFLDAIRGMRNSWQSWDKMDSMEFIDNGECIFSLGEADKKLMQNLIRAGQDHAKFLRQIFVSFDLLAPEYFWKEFDTYKIGTCANSTSMMHTLGKDHISHREFSMEDVESDLKAKYMALIREAQRRWFESGKKKPSKEWRQMNQLVAISYIYRRTVTLNYAVLSNMYHSRKNHRLDEWKVFAKWIEDYMPYSFLITGKEKEKTPN
jgi:hypothetical protein